MGGFILYALLWLGAAWGGHRAVHWLRATRWKASAILGTVAVAIDVPLAALAAYSVRHDTGDGARLASAVILAVSVVAWPAAVGAGLLRARHYGDSRWATALAFFPEALLWGALAAPATLVFRLR